MNYRCVFKFSLVGFALQIVIHIFAGVAGISVRKPLLGTLYWPWIKLGGALDSSSGAGGHAFQGGVILGYLTGVFVYSLLIGAAICYFKQARQRS
jgi:hypothetical protein